MKKDKRNKLYIGLFIVFLMVSSTIGFIYSSEDGNKYNEYSFTLTENGWVTYIKELNMYWSFDYLPKELDFEVNIGFISDQIAVSIKDDRYFYELSSKFALLGIITSRINDSAIYCNLENPIFVFTEGNYNKIYKEDSCTYFEGDSNQLIDRLFYHLLGVM